MEKTKYKDLVNKHTPKEDVFYNAIIAFLIGGLMGIIAQGLIDFYSYYLRIFDKHYLNFFYIFYLIHKIFYLA